MLKRDAGVDTSAGEHQKPDITPQSWAAKSAGTVLSRWPMSR